MQVAIAGPNLNDQSKGTFHVHAAGCADLKRGARREPEYGNAWVIEAASQTEVCDAVYPADQFECESGEYVYDFNFFPCCDQLEA